MQITWEVLLLLLTPVSVVFNMIYTARNDRRSNAKDMRETNRDELAEAKDDAREAQGVASQLAQLNAEMQKQGLMIANVNNGVGDIRVEIRGQRETIQTVIERLTRVEESAKQAHKRIDRMDPQRAHDE